MTVPVLLVEPSILQSVAPAVGAVLAAGILALTGFFGYRRQKEADRQYDLVKLRQQEYEQYLLAFSESSRWKGVDDGRWEQAQNVYHNTQNFMLLHASAEVIKAVNTAHRYYVEAERVDWRTYKKLYAEMIKAMRKDGFSPTELSVQELADNIPWTIGTEPEDRKALGEAQQPHSE